MAPSRRRTGSSLGPLLIATLCGLTAWALVERGLSGSTPLPVAVGLAFAIAGLGVLMRWRLAPLLAGVCFGVLAGGHLLSLVMGWVAVTATGVLSVVVWVWASFYLFSRRARRDLTERRPPPDRSELGSFAIAVLLSTTVAGALITLGLAPWAAMIGFFVVFLVYERRFARVVSRWLEGAVGRRPRDIDAAHARTFRAARFALGRGDFDRAERLAAGLPDSASSQLFRRVVRAERAIAGDGIEHIVFSGDWVVAPVALPRINDELPAFDVHGAVVDRVALLDELCRDRASARPAFARDFDRLLPTLSGRIIGRPDHTSYLRWWEASRASCAEAPITWATLRFIDAWCIEAAVAVAERGEDALLIELARLAAAVATAPGTAGVDDEDRSPSLMLAPSVADEVGLLLVGAPLSRELGTGELVKRLRLRLQLVDRVRELWPTYADILSTTKPFLLHVLTDCGARIAQSVEAFDVWWASHAEEQARFDQHLEAGLLAAWTADWELAEHGFAQAVEAWPARQCARFNLAMSHEHMGRYDEEAALLHQLVEEEPGEALWRMKLGDVDLHRGDLLGALAHLEDAARLGGFVHGLSLRMGVVLARLGRFDEARLHLQAELGPDADPGDLSGLTEAINRVPSQAAGIVGLPVQPDASADAPAELERDDDGGDDEPPPTFH